MKEVPRYFVEWLAESIQRGANVELSAVRFSLDKGIPYVCETEEEMWLFEGEDNPLQDSTEGIYNALLKYGYGNTAKENKRNYWLN